MIDARIGLEQVKDLPLNGRNWSTLTAFVPGAVDTGGSIQRSIRFAGRGLDDNNFTYDGIDATNIVNQAQQPFVRLTIPTDAIQEFRVDTMLFTAENGSTPGGQIAVASKTGSNDLHGSLFEFLRNDIFDARQPIDTLNPHKPAFRLNQYGGNVGALILHARHGTVLCNSTSASLSTPLPLMCPMSLQLQPPSIYMLRHAHRLCVSQSHGINKTTPIAICACLKTTHIRIVHGRNPTTQPGTPALPPRTPAAVP